MAAAFIWSGVTLLLASRFGTFLMSIDASSNSAGVSLSERSPSVPLGQALALWSLGWSVGGIVFGGVIYALSSTEHGTGTLTLTAMAVASWSGPPRSARAAQHASHAGFALRSCGGANDARGRVCGVRTGRRGVSGRAGSAWGGGAERRRARARRRRR